MGARRATNVVFKQCFISKCLVAIQSCARLNQLYQVVGALNQKCNGFQILRTLITFNLLQGVLNSFGLVELAPVHGR